MMIDDARKHRDGALVRATSGAHADAHAASSSHPATTCLPWTAMTFPIRPDLVGRERRSGRFARAPNKSPSPEPEGATVLSPPVAASLGLRRGRRDAQAKHLQMLRVRPAQQQAHHFKLMLAGRRTIGHLELQAATFAVVRAVALRVAQPHLSAPASAASPGRTTLELGALP